MTVLRIAILLALTASVPVHAASNVSAKFDGVYEGAATPVPIAGAEGCTAFTLTEISISAGFLKTAKGTPGPMVSGLITEQGYVAAFLTRPGHQRSPLAGRLEDGVISAGLIESDSGCAWIVHLRRRPYTIPFSSYRTREQPKPQRAEQYTFSAR